MAEHVVRVRTLAIQDFNQVKLIVCILKLILTSIPFQ